jgi:hypothetical protein
MSVPPLERFCQHHHTSQFRCGESGFDVELQGLYRGLDQGDETVVFVLSTARRHVAGYIAMRDFELESPVTGEVARYFFIPAVAVATRLHGTVAFRRLVTKAIEVGQFRRRAKPDRYDGILCITFTNQKLNTLLERLGFRALPEDEFFVWRAFPD